MSSFLDFVASCKKLLIVMVLVAAGFESPAQKQLIFIYRGNVTARYSEGGTFKCVLKNGERKSGFIVELHDFSMITSNDTLAFQSIAKIKVRGPSKLQKRVGGLLMIMGFGYVAVDQVNAAFGYNPQGFDQADTNGLIVGAVGAGIFFIRPAYRRLKPGTAIRTVDYKSPFYLSDR